jgi:arylsulfatase A-like enzyme
MQPAAAVTQKSKSELLNTTTARISLHKESMKTSTEEWAVSIQKPITIESTISRANLSTTNTKKETTSDQQPPEKEDSSAPRKPLNVLIMYPDDWRHDTLGCAGTQPVQTPFLDYLASKGIRFTHNCVTTSVCWISRATLFTGQFLSRHGSDRPVHPRFYQQWYQTWPYLLGNAGYWTGHIGKWQFHDYEFVEKQYNYTYLYEGFHWTENPDQTPGQPKNIHSTDLYENITIEFLRNRPKDVPFALTTAFYAPKAVGEGPDQWYPKNETLKMYENVTVPEPFLDGNTSFEMLPSFFKQTEGTNAGRTRWVDRFGSGRQYQYSMKRYYALITEVDNAIKNIYDELERQGILNETLIIFTTDNGFFHGEHGLGGKWWPYQESIRVPLIIQDPRMPQEKVGTLDDSFTLNIDLASTILSAANIESPPVMQGRDIADLYLKKDGKEKWRKEFFYEHPTHFGTDHIPSSSALVRKDFKYMLYPDWNVEQLFDLKNDPYEYYDIVNNSDYRGLVVQMRNRHHELKQQAA